MLLLLFVVKVLLYMLLKSYCIAVRIDILIMIICLSILSLLCMSASAQNCMRLMRYLVVSNRSDKFKVQLRFSVGLVEFIAFSELVVLLFLILWNRFAYILKISLIDHYFWLCFCLKLLTAGWCLVDYDNGPLVVKGLHLISVDVFWWHGSRSHMLAVL